MKLSLKSFVFYSILTLSLSTSAYCADDQTTRDPWAKTAANTYNTASSWAAPQNNAAPETFPEIDKLRKRMGEFLNQGMDDLQKKGYVENQGFPRTDIIEKDGVFFLLLDLPGMTKDKINVEVKGQEIMISGERKVEDQFKTSNLIKIERKYGNFQRSFTIPEEFLADQIAASYENGVLQVRVPKKNVTQVVQPKTIAVN